MFRLFRQKTLNIFNVGIDFDINVGSFWHQLSILFRSHFFDAFLDVGFSIFDRIGSRRGHPKMNDALDFCRPKTLRKPIHAATSVFHRFCIDFGRYFGYILMISASFQGYPKAFPWGSTPRRPQLQAVKLNRSAKAQGQA